MDSSWNSAPRDVVYVVASMIVGGTQTHLLQVFRFIDRQRYRPHLYCLRDGGDLIETARSLDVPVTSFGMRGSLRHPQDVRGLFRMRAALRTLEADVVHGYLLRGNFYAALASRLAGGAVVVTSRRGLHRPVGLAERIAVRTSNGLSAAITGNSPAVLEFTEEVEGPLTTPMVMIPSGIDTERFDPAHSRGLRDELGLGDAPVIGTAITFRPRKGFRMLFEAFAAVRERIEGARLLVAGVAEYADEPARLASALGIVDAVTLLGRRSDMPEVLASLDAFVLPSESEGMSNAILEAMAMGLPVVATAVGGNPVVLEEGVSGYLVDYADSATMAERLVSVLEDRRAAASMGRAGRDRVVADYSARSMVSQMEDLYDRLLGEARA